MNCTSCKANKIGPETTPFGGFLCSNEHLQCNECNTKKMGVYLICSASTKFLQMKFAAPMPTEPCPSVFAKKMSDEIEIQSRLSKEHLSMSCSEESMKSTHEEETNFAPAKYPMSFIGNLDEHNLSKCLNAKDRLSDDAKIIQVPTSPADKSAENATMLANPFDANELNSVDLAEGMQNVTAFEPIKSKCLSAKVLQDFDSHNFGLKKEVIDNYLKTCSPTSFYSSPAYNCKNSDCHFVMKPRKQKCKLEMKSISISTESDPSLKSTCSQISENNIVGKLNHQDYYTMQTVEVTPVAQVVNLITDKTQNAAIMDMRMQKIFGTLKEDFRINGFDEQPYLTKTQTQIPAKQQQESWTGRISYNKEDKNPSLMDQLSNTYRAFYNLPPSYIPPANNLHILHKPQPAQQEPPAPQFERVPCTSGMIQELLLKQSGFPNIKTVPANLLHIPRSPILCPESTCLRMIFVSDFNKHLVIDHSHLPMERITPLQCKNFFLDMRLFKNGTSNCRLLYLMCDKIIGLGSTEYKDFLPILVMTSRISLQQIYDLRNQESSAFDYFLIWVTGLAPEELPVSVSLTVWSRADGAPSCHVAYSGQIYSIRNSQRALDVWESGKTLLLSAQQIAALHNGTEMLNLQLSVH